MSKTSSVLESNTIYELVHLRMVRPDGKLDEKWFVRLCGVQLDHETAEHLTYGSALSDYNARSHARGVTAAE
jgi:hypothetical protein